MKPGLRRLTLDNEAPIVSGVFADPNPAPVNTDITLTATVDDTTTGNSNIAAAEYSIDLWSMESHGSGWMGTSTVL